MPTENNNIDIRVYDFLLTSPPQAKQTWGMEIETYADDVWNDPIIANNCNLHHDGSGPAEFILGPYEKHYVPLNFIDYIAKYLRRNENDQGNHIHLLSRDYDEFDNIFHNLKFLNIALRPLLATHSNYSLRKRWKEWCQTDFLYVDGSPSCEDFEDRYNGVTINCRKSVDTIEVRVSETHPLRAWAFQYIVFEFTAKYGDIWNKADPRISVIEDIYDTIGDDGDIYRIDTVDFFRDKLMFRTTYKDAGEWGWHIVKLVWERLPMLVKMIAYDILVEKHNWYNKTEYNLFLKRVPRLEKIIKRGGK